jgi:hypothetical protein
VSAETSLQTRLSTEESRALSAEASLSALGSSGLSTEVSRAISAETSLQSRLSTEESRAASVETSESSRAVSAETSLQTRLSTEESRASSVETSESSRAVSAETSLQSRLSTEESRALSAEISLSALGSSGLSTEVSRAISAETSLQSRLSTEESRAASVETSESSRAVSAETSLQSRLSTEESRTLAADNSLEVRVSAEESRFTGTFNGTITQSTLKLSGTCEAQTFTTTSDARLKTDVEEITGALSTVVALRPVEYNWVDGRATINPGHKEVGFIAQELEAVVPEVVATSDGELPGLKRVAYDRIVSLLVAAVKELKAEVDALKAAAAAK